MRETLNIPPEKDARALQAELAARISDEQKGEVREGVHLAVSGAVEELEKQKEDAKMVFKIRISEIIEEELKRQEAEGEQLSGPDKMRMAILSLRNMERHFTQEELESGAREAIEEMLKYRETEYESFEEHVNKNFSRR